MDNMICGNIRLFDNGMELTRIRKIANELGIDVTSLYDTYYMWTRISNDRCASWLVVGSDEQIRHVISEYIKENSHANNSR